MKRMGFRVENVTAAGLRVLGRHADADKETASELEFADASAHAPCVEPVCLLALLCSAVAYALVPEVMQAAKSGDFGTADKILKQYRAQHGVNPEFLEADSWVGRGRLLAKSYAAALQNADEVRQLCLKQLAARKLDAEPSLPTALGASIEVTAQSLASPGAPR